MSMNQTSDWHDLFFNTSPYAWAYFGIAISLGSSIVGAAWLLANQGDTYNWCKFTWSIGKGTSNKI